MRTRTALVLLLACSASLASVSPQSAQLEQLRKDVEANPSPAIEVRYLETFPASFESFRKTFYGADLDELYPTHTEHLQLLERLQKRYPEKVLKIWLGVATNGSWDADALSHLQHQFVSWGSTNTKELAAALTSRPTKDRLSIIRFLADVENHSVYTEYQAIMNNLQMLGAKELYKEFANAKEQRIKRRDH